MCSKHTNLALKLKALGKVLPRFDDVEPDHIVEKHEAKHVDALLHNIPNLVTLSESLCQDIPTVDFKNKSSQEYPVFVKH